MLVLTGPSSVFELLTVKDKERLQQEAVSRKLPVQSQAPASEKPSDSQLPALGARLTSSSEFKPFLKNPEKQKRYEEYVEKLNSGQSSALASCLDPNMTEWEREREQYEFSRAAMLYRSTSASLSSRFTRAMVSDDKDTVEVIEQQESDVNDQEAAVKMKMFGRLTRDKFEWHPEKLLCKRFNVPDPYPGSTKSGLLKVKRDKYSVFNFLNVHTAPEPQKMESKTETIKHTRALKPPESRRPSRWDVSAEDKEKGLTDHASGLIGSDSTGETSLTQHTEKEVHQGSETETVELIPFRVITAHTNQVSCCKFCFSDSRFLTCSFDGRVILWDLLSGTTISEFRLQSTPLTECCISYDNQRIFTTSWDKSLKAWDVETGKVLDHQDWVLDVAISSNNKWILSACKDSTVRLWDIEKIEQIPVVKAAWKEHGERVVKCTHCEKPFSRCHDDSSENLTICVFCRLSASPRSSLRTAPSMPSIPTVPSMPSIRTAPSVPSIPSVSTLPSVPSIPSVSTLPSIPSVSTLPSVSSLPSISESTPKQ
ncbi:hypothetical protein chiPu_0020749 [Chiloscyllium punctatum]|uniref:Uncharacterized protein n=1 Tax=Chiloscyllium punctatum TaxID=137246 RepID=A0A401RJ94_CHIPU|nr:hypothetical protein [Chiloscyllium punctatum]